MFLFLREPLSALTWPSLLTYDATLWEDNWVLLGTTLTLPSLEERTNEEPPE